MLVLLADNSQFDIKQYKALSKSGRFVYYIYRLFWSSLDLIYPPICGGCDIKGIRWCPECASKISVLCEPFCPICGNKQQTRSVCGRCSQQRPMYFQLRSWGYFNGSLRNAIHKLKYNKDLSLAEILSRQLIEMIINLGWTLDMVVPVPLGRERIKTRGYNQAALIALPVALGLDLKYRPKALAKVRETNSQVGLSYEHRYENVSGAFLARSPVVVDKRILIVDDVVTSGATINACANALINSGAKVIFAVSLARAMYN